MAKEPQVVTYTPGGPVANAFHHSDAFIRGLMGPVGSSKSSACWMEMVKRSTQQAATKSGMRRTHCGVFRNTYPELTSTTMRTVMDWCPFMKVTWGSPIKGLISQKLNDGTWWHFEITFIALERPEEVDKIGSLELTFAWANEVREMAKAVFDKITERVGRFPAKKDGGATWKGMVADTNPPDDDHWYYKLAEKADPVMVQNQMDVEAKLVKLGILPKGKKLMEFFRQPGGLIQTSTGYEPNPKAENIENLDDGFGYYLRQVVGKRPEWIKAQILGEYATTVDGKPVYPEYSDEMHTKVCAPLHGLPIIVGLDYGRSPAAAFAQLTPRGQLRFIDELWADDTGIEAFAEDVLKPHVAMHYPEYEIIYTGDPAGIAKEGDDKDAFMRLAECGIVATPATGANKLLGRIEAVNHYMNRMAGGQPALAVDPKCVRLRKGFIGRYHFRRVQTTREIYKDIPEKDEYSHIHDAAQYAALYTRSEDVSGGGKFKAKIKYPEASIV